MESEMHTWIREVTLHLTVEEGCRFYEQIKAFYDIICDA